MVGVQLILVLALIEYLLLGFNAGRARVQIRYQGARHHGPSDFRTRTSACIRTRSSN